MTDPKSIRAIDAVVNIWTEEALSHRPDWGDDFFVGKMKAKSNIMPGLSLTAMIERMDAAGIEHAFLIAAKSGRAGLRAAITCRRRLSPTRCSNTLTSFRV